MAGAVSSSSGFSWKAPACCFQAWCKTSGSSSWSAARLVIAGEALLGSLVMNVTIAQWFVRKRGRAMGIANLGTGVAKFTIPLCAASLFVLVGWRSTWAIFGIVAPLLVVVPALIFMRRRPEDIGLYPDGEPPLQSPDKVPAAGETSPTEQRRTIAGEKSWRRSEVIRLPTFWLLVVTFGIASVGIAGLNLHIFSYVTDIGYSPLIAASFMSTIALTQLGSTLIWGVLPTDSILERFPVSSL